MSKIITDLKNLSDEEKKALKDVKEAEYYDKKKEYDPDKTIEVDSKLRLHSIKPEPLNDRDKEYLKEKMPQKYEEFKGKITFYFYSDYKEFPDWENKLNEKQYYFGAAKGPLSIWKEWMAKVHIMLEIVTGKLFII